MARWPAVPLLAAAVLAGTATLATAQGDPAPGAAIASDLGSDDPEVRARVVESARTLGVADVRSICAWLSDARPQVRSGARRALENLAASGSARPEAPELAAIFIGLAREMEELPAHEREHLVRLSGLVGNATTLPLLAELIDDGVLAVAALFAIERIGGERAAEVLVARLERTGALPIQILIGAIGALREETAVPRLLELAQREPTGTVAQTARAALAALGDPRAEDVLALDLATDVRREDARNALRFLQRAEGVSDRGVTTLLALLACKDPQVRAGAVLLLPAWKDRPWPQGRPRPHLLVADALNDDARCVRRAAQEALVARTDLIRPWKRAPGEPLRPEHLPVAASERAVEGFLRARVRSSGALDDVRSLARQRAGFPIHGRAALRVLADYANAEDRELLSSAYQESPELASVLGQGLLRVADQDIEAGRSAEALAILEHLLRGDLARPALARLERLANPDSLAALESLPASSELREPVAAVRLAVAERLVAAGEVERARPVLREVAGTARARKLRERTGHLLSRIGDDVGQLAQARGFLIAWRILGPLPESSPEQLPTLPFDPAALDLERSVAVEGRTLAWSERRSEDLDGAIDLTTLEPHENVAALAVADLDWPEAQEVELWLGSDDGIAVWVNGHLVHQHQVARPLEPDDDRVRVRFEKGTNRLLLKITQLGGGFGFCVRLAEPGGGPIDLRR